MKKFNLTALYIFTASLIFWGCAEENPNLVNPPPLFESVKMRFINLAGDGSLRKLRLDNHITPAVSYGEATEPFSPGTDSAYYELLNGNASVYKTVSRIRFSRNMTYTVVALPTDDGRDSIVAFTNSPAQIQQRRSASLKLFNGVRDSAARYSLRFGCPSGPPIGSELGFRGFGSMNLIESGKITFSIIKRVGTDLETIGTFSDSLNEFSQNVVIIYKGVNGKEEVAILEETAEKGGYKKPEKITDLYYSVRTINLSSKPIDLHRAGDGSITTGLIPLRVDGFRKIESCGSLVADTLQVIANGDMTAKLTVSPQAGKNYTAVVLDSGSKMTISLIPEEKWDMPAGKASIQVVNASQKVGAITVSLGARTPKSMTKGFVTGEALARNLDYAQWSDASYISEKYLPITIFSAGSQTRLIGCFVGEIAAGESDLMIVYDGPDGTLQTAIAHAKDVDMQLAPLERAAFYQAINLAADYVDLTLEPAFNLDSLSYTNSLSTALPPQSITLQGVTNKAGVFSQAFTPDPAKRLLHIITGTEFNPTVLQYSYDPVVSTAFAYKRRFVNVSDLPTVGLKFNESDAQFAASLVFGEISAEESISKSDVDRVTFYFVNPADGKTALTVSDNFIVGKSYTIIFAGNKSRGYSIISHQEF